MSLSSGTITLRVGALEEYSSPGFPVSCVSDLILAYWDLDHWLYLFYNLFILSLLEVEVFAWIRGPVCTKVEIQFHSGGLHCWLPGSVPSVSTKVEYPASTIAPL